MNQEIYPFLVAILYLFLIYFCYFVTTAIILKFPSRLCLINLDILVCCVTKHSTSDDKIQEIIKQDCLSLSSHVFFETAVKCWNPHDSANTVK